MPPATDPLPVSRRTRIDRGLDLLTEARQDAAGIGADVWQFALRIAELHAVGLTTADVRWLVSRGFVLHAVERTEPAAAERTFAPAANLGLTANSSFILRHPLPVGAPPPPPPPATAAPAHPQWHGARRELYVGDTLVKRFRVPAPSQELILAAFEEDHWPAHVDDPLPSGPGVDPAQRLHDAVRGLNRSQRHRLIRFERDGRGRGVCWYPGR